MTTKEPFEHHAAALDYAEGHDLVLVWEGTAAFEKRRRNVPPDQFEVRQCITRRGIANCGLYPKAIEKVEWEAKCEAERHMRERVTVSPWQFGHLQMFSFEVIIAAPPWGFADPDAIKALRVGELACGDCLLLLRTTGRAIATCQAQEVARAWGFNPISEIVWQKRTQNDKPRMAAGYRVRTLHEPILVCTLGNPRHMPLLSSFDGTAREHSRKPEEFYEMVAKHTPGANRCDLFSRETREGFTGWGDEHGKFDAHEQMENLE